ncbi:MAG: FecR family protein [Bacteroidetes bacterium]|nr:FecR family protein [Bacteroidota bacterium]MBL6943583.1 FecR family protein [Bacteroidales bacterium]
MNYNDKHINNNDNHSEMDFFAMAEIPYSKKKEEIWNQLSSELEAANSNPKASISVQKVNVVKPRLIFGIAATLLILLGTFSLLRFYNTTIYCPANKHLAVNFPDGSTSTMNSNSTITYYPLWWQFSRRVSLSGEAFFNVEEGTNFYVSSSLGKTMVLGTSFNIFSRGDEYSVTCVTGTVKVVSITKKAVILSPDYHAEINKNGDIKISKTNNASGTVDWMDDMFNFTSVPLSIVIDEIEQQYNVTITSNTELDYFYTGHFSKNKSVEEVLNLLCKPFGLTFVKKSKSNYHIVQN